MTTVTTSKNTNTTLSAGFKDANKQNSKQLVDQIIALKEKRQAVILAHNYQIPEIQDIADFVGDSLGLSIAASKTQAKTIVFCGVHFMAETAAIISPDKKVLIPDLNAGCSLASSISLNELLTWKREHPGAVVVSYVNTTAEIKAESDYCCTSSNALNIVRSIPKDQEILFLPDMFLGSWVKKMTGRDNMHIWMGECHVHAKVHPNRIQEVQKDHPKAELLIHPECGCLTPYLDHVTSKNGESVLKVASTEGMLQQAKKSCASEFIVATEEGILHRMKKENPDKTFYPIEKEMTCMYMKMITLDNLYHCLQNDEYQVTVDKEIADNARLAISRMLAIV